MNPVIWGNSHQSGDVSQSRDLRPALQEQEGISQTSTTASKQNSRSLAIVSDRIAYHLYNYPDSLQHRSSCVGRQDCSFLGSVTRKGENYDGSLGCGYPYHF